MFDKIKIRKRLSAHDKVNKRYISNIKSKDFINNIGKKIPAHNGYVKNLYIFLKRSEITIHGSLPKFRFDNSYSTPTRQETESIINELSTGLNIDLSDGHISYLELSRILHLKKDIKEYIKLFDGCKDMRKQESYEDGISFKNKSRRITLYNKKTAPNYPATPPKHHFDKNLLRIEIKLIKGVRDKLERFYSNQRKIGNYYPFDNWVTRKLLRVRDLYQKDTFRFFYDYWLDMVLSLTLKKDACKTTYDEFIEACKNSLTEETNPSKPIHLYTKSSGHLENSKHQSKKDYEEDQQAPITTRFDHIIENTLNNTEKKKFEILRKKAVEYSISYKGIDLTESEHKAIHSIQTLMTLKGYYKQYLEDKEIKPFEFTPSEFLDAYGVGKFKTKRGKLEYSGKCREFALQSLMDVTKKQCYIYYETKYYIQNKKGKTEERFDLIREIAPILNLAELYGNLTREEKDKIITSNFKNSNRITKIAIQPHKVLIDQIDKYFVMKPSNYLTEITEKQKRTSKFTIAVIDLLFTYVSRNTNTSPKRDSFDWCLERGWKELAINIRMTESSYWKKGNWKKCREIIIDSYNKAKELGYIIKYELDVKGLTKTLDRIYLNKKEFYKPREITE